MTRNIHRSLPAAGAGTHTTWPRRVGPGLAVASALCLTAAPALAESPELAPVVVESTRPITSTEGATTSLQSFSGDDVAKSAGALQDVSRYAQTLAGVSTGYSRFSDQLLVRGGTSEENLFVVDEMQLPSLSHYSNFTSAGGVFSLLDATMIRDVQFLSGGFPAQFGDSLSSVMVVNQREGERDRVHLRADSRFFDGGVGLEGPIPGVAGSPPQGSWVMGVRRTFIDVIGRTADSGRQGGLPVVVTFNAKITYDIGTRDRLWLVSVDGVDRVTAQPLVGEKNDQEIDNFTVHYRSAQTANALAWRHRFGENGSGLLSVSDVVYNSESTVRDLLRNGVPPVGEPLLQQIAAAPVTFDSTVREGRSALRYDLALELPLLQRFQAGIALARLGDEYRFRTPYGDDNPYSLVPGINPLDVRARPRTTQPSAYVQSTQQLLTGLRATWGVRVDDYRDLAARRASPRLGLSYEAGQSLTLTGSAGTSYQKPPAQFVAAFAGRNGALRPVRADQAALGAAWQAGGRTNISVEAYVKRYRDTPVSTQFPGLSLANLGEILTPNEVLFPIESSGHGRAFGLEANVETAVSRALLLRGNLSLARTRYSAADGVARDGAFDHRATLHATATYRTPGRWTFSGDYTFQSGRPYTPFDNALSVAQRRPVYDTSRLLSAHLPSSSELDLRADYAMPWHTTPASFFIAVLNAANARPIAGYEWNRRTNLPQADRESGIFPMIGGEVRF